MSDHELSILIRLVSDVSGAEAAKKVLSEFKAEAKGAGESASESFRASSHEMHEFHMLTRLVGSQLGEFGHLLHFIFSPEALGIAGLIIGAKMLHDQFEENIKQAMKWADLQREIKIAYMQASDEAERSMQAQIDAFSVMMQHRRDGFDEIKNMIAEQTRLETEAADHQKALADVEQSQYDAFIDKKVKAGKLTAQQGEQAKADEKQRVADIKEKQDESKLQAGIDAKAKEAQLKTAELNANNPNAKYSDVQLDAARLVAQNASKAAGKNKVDVSTREEKTLPELEAAAKEARDELAAIKFARQGVLGQRPATVADKFGSGLYLAAEQAKMLAAGDSPDKLKARAESYEKSAQLERDEVANLKDKQTVLDDAAKAAAANVDEIQSKQKEFSNALDQLTIEIQQQTDALARQKKEYGETRAASQPGFYEHKEAQDAAAALKGKAATDAMRAALDAGKHLTMPGGRANVQLDQYGHETEASLLQPNAMGGIDLDSTKKALAVAGASPSGLQALADAVNEHIKALKANKDVTDGLLRGTVQEVLAHKRELQLRSAQDQAYLQQLGQIKGQVQELQSAVPRHS